MISDRISPIVVKELRQAVRSRIFVGLFGVTLLASLIIVLYALGNSSGISAGRDVFYALFFCLAVVGFVVVPMAAHRSLSREQEDGAWDLLQLTGLGPRRILAGKLASTLVQGAFFAIVVTPFLVFSYYLNGIDLETIAVLISYATVVTGALSVGALFMAALPTSRPLRAGMQLLCLLGLVLALGFAYAGAVALATNHRLFDDQVGPFEVVCFVFGLGSTSLILFEAAAARLALATEAYARAPRRALVVAILGTAALALFRIRTSSDHDGPLFAQAITMLVLFLAAPGLAADLDVARGRAAAEPFLLRPGSLPGFRFLVLLVALSTALWSGVALSLGGRNLAAIVATGAYVLIYVGVPVLLCRAHGFQRLWPADVVRAVMLAVAAVGSLLPPAVAGLLSAHDWRPLELVSPFTGLDRLDGSFTGGRAGEAMLVCGLALVVTIATDRVLARRALATR